MSFMNEMAVASGSASNASMRAGYWLSVLAALGVALPASAQDLMEEVMVTAQKREESAQDVGIAITAFSGDQLSALGFTTSTEIAAMVPGVFIGGNVAGQNSMFTIRGVVQNDFNDHTESPVAVYVDDAYVAMAQGQGFAMHDMDRVEVLKGPQGTLFGRNATGGLIHYITRKPSDETDGYLELEYGDYDRVRIEGALGGALSDRVFGRLSGMWTEHDEILKNDYQIGTSEGVPPGNEYPRLAPDGAPTDLWNDRTVALRGQLLFDLNDAADLLLSVNYADSEVSAGQYQSEPTIAVLDQQGRQRNALRIGPNETARFISFETGDGFNFFPGDPGRPVPGGDWFGYLDPDGDDLDHSSVDFAFDDLNTMESLGATAKLDWNIGANTLVSVTDYKTYEKYFGMDVDAAPLNQLSVWFDSEVWQLTQELRLQGATERMRWVTGLYYMHVDYDDKTGFKALPGADNSGIPPGTEGFDYPAEVKLETDSYSVFGQIDYDIVERVTLIAGLRVIQEEKDYAYEINGYLNANVSAKEFAVGSPLFPLAAPFKDDSSDTLWAGKLQLDWRPSDDVLLYAGINRGIKAGSFNAPIDFGGAQANPNFRYDYDEEVLTSYEVGFKSTLFAGTSRLNGAFYYYDYKDYQSFLFSGVSGVVVNNDATIFGGELEFVTSPIDGLNILLGAAAFDAEVENVEVAPGIFADTKPSYAPELQVSGLIRYAWPVLGGELAAQGDFNYSDEFFYNLRNHDAHEYDSYVVGNIRLSFLTGDAKWEFSAFVDNVADERYNTIGFDISQFCGCSEIMTGPPRWWGVQAKRNFGL
jgi:iron complex outermembrane receptor protein